MRAGDHVRHRPSGEDWVVAFAEGGCVCPCGWPLSLADQSDCELIRTASDEEYAKTLQDLAAIKDRTDPRYRHACRALDVTDEAVDAPEKVAPNPATSWALNPWNPMTRPIDLKHLGKLAEETNELGSAISRCVIQGIDEREPVTRKLNRDWLQDEIADVLANIELVREHFGLDATAIRTRAERKKAHLRGWHSMSGER